MNAALDKLTKSVIAVPPLARNQDLSLNQQANRELIEYLQGGRVRTVLYGGNANLYHLRISEYASLLGMLSELASDTTEIIPSVGPAYGTMMDQAPIVREFAFPTVMVLPHRDLATWSGIATGIREFVEAAGVPIVLYLKYDGWLDVDTTRRLVDDGLVSWIKYAVVREQPAEDAYLRRLVDEVSPQRIVSGIGEQPAITHVRDFGLASFTSGCVCVAPAMSMRMLQALHRQEYSNAETLREQFEPLENLRNQISPIRVLHDAVRLAEICDTGPILPLLSATSQDQQHAIKQAAVALRQIESSTMV